MLDKIPARAGLHHTDPIPCLEGQDVIRAVVAVGILPIRKQVLCQDIELIARAHMAASGKLFPAFEDLYPAVAPADVSRALRRFLIAQHRGVLFHKGNRYLSNTKKQELDQFDTPEDIKRILVGNMIILANLMNGAACQRFGIMETMRPTQELPITDGCIIRTAANIQLDEESVLLYEVVRSGPHAMRKLADKVGRYYTLINDPRYRENNYYGYKSVPQLIICGERYEHCIKIDQYLRSRGLINKTDNLLYTEDLFYVQRTLQTLYELDEEGKRTWYSLPERHVYTDMERIA